MMIRGEKLLFVVRGNRFKAEAAACDEARTNRDQLGVDEVIGVHDPRIRADGANRVAEMGVGRLHPKVAPRGI